MNFITVEVVSWKKYQNKTRDLKRPWWFALSNTLVEDPAFYDFTAVQFKAWIYILSQASRQQRSTVQIFLNHAQSVANIPKEDMCSALDLLVKIGCCEILLESGRNPAVIRPRSDEHITLHYITRQDTTGENQTPAPIGSEAKNFPLREKTNTEERKDLEIKPRTKKQSNNNDIMLSVWNENRRTLPKALSMSKSRKVKADARLHENPDVEYWVEVVKRLASSDFCSGKNDKGWVADFDFFLKPDTHIRVMEGRYSNKTKSSANGMNLNL